MANLAAVFAAKYNRKIFVPLRDRARHTILCGKYRRRLKNTSPSLISQNCAGCMMLHDLGLRFNSPTVNLWMSDTDFIDYVNHLKEYSAAVPSEAPDGHPYPVGRLCRDGGEIRIYFQHYSDFASAAAKWTERSKRIDYDNLFIIMGTGDTVEKHSVEAFEGIEYPHKVLLREKHETPSPSSFVTCMDKSLFTAGKYLRYIRRHSLRRYYDEFDFTEFINIGKISASDRNYR